MSDLSKVLGDLYGDSNPDAAPVRREASAADRSVTSTGEGAASGFADETSQWQLGGDQLAGVSASASEAADEWAEKLEQREARSHQLWHFSNDDVIPNWDRRRKRKKR